ncbi:MAG: phosphopantetheine-binding protein [Burkholderiaceae bacterium]
MPTTFERLRDILVKDYSIDPAKVTPDANLESLGVDSLGVAELLFNIEDEFRIKLPSEPVQLATAGEVAGFIDELIAAQAGTRAAAGSDAAVVPAAPDPVPPG